ncbi:MAG TPA: phosphatase PAP2 family protein [Dehalococcoidia bacterium]
MAISSQDAGLSESAGGLVSTSGIVLAASRTGRYLSIVALLLILWLMRPQANPLVNLLYTGAAVGCLYFAFGRRESFRPLILYAVAFGTFAQLRSMADDTGLPAQFAYVVDMEERVFGVIPSAWLQERFYRPGVIGPLDGYLAVIYVSYFVVAHGVALLIWNKKRELFPLYASALFLTLYAGLLTSFLLPTAPPWLAASDGYIEPVHRVMGNILAEINPGAQAEGATIVGVNDIAAMPSLHMATTVLVALAALRFAAPLRLAGVAYALSMGLSLVYLGEHYAVDVIAGALLAVAAWQLVPRLWPSRAASRLTAIAPLASAGERHAEESTAA